MAIPVFPGADFPQSRLRVPVENLEIDAYLAGQRAGLQEPSTATALTEGVQGLVENLRKGDEFQRDKERDELLLRKGRLEVEAAEASQPQQLQVDQLELQNRKAELEGQIQKRQKEDELLSVISNPNPQMKVDAVMSGKYSDVFADNPRLFDVAVRSAAPYMSEREQRIFLKQQNARKAQTLTEKSLGQLVPKYDQAMAEMRGDSAFLKVLGDFGNSLNEVELARRIEAVPSGAFQQDPQGAFVLDPETGERLPSPNFDPSVSIRTHDWIDTETGNILARNVPTESTDKVEKARGYSQQIGGVLTDNNVEAIVRRQLGETPGSKASPRPASTKTQQRAPQVAPVSAPVPPPAVDPNQPMPRISIQDFGRSVPQFVTKSGKVAPTPEFGKLFVQSLDLQVKPETVNKYGHDVRVLTEAINNQNEPLPPAFRSQQRASLAVAKERFVRGLLEEEYEQNKEQLKNTYNRAAVKNYNESLAQRLPSARMLGQAAVGLIAPSFFPEGPIFSSQQIKTPKELYVTQNFDRVSSRVDALLTTTEGQLRMLSQKRLSSGEAIQNAAQILKNYK